jgi:hypothetical protein
MENTGMCAPQNNVKTCPGLREKLDGMLAVARRIEDRCVATEDVLFGSNEKQPVNPQETKQSINTIDFMLEELWHKLCNTEKRLISIQDRL